jgi:hypothetical protein
VGKQLVLQTRSKPRVLDPRASMQRGRGSFGGAAFSPSVHGSAMRRRGSDAFSDDGSVGGGSDAGGGSAVSGSFYTDTVAQVRAGVHCRASAPFSRVVWRWCGRLPCALSLTLSLTLSLSLSLCAPQQTVQHEDRSNGAEFASFSGLSSALGGLFNSATLSDVVIEAAEDGKTSSDIALRIPAHRVVLAGWSDVWMRLMTHVPREQTELGTREPVVRINGYPPNVILQLVEFCYKGKTKVTLDTAIPLLAVSRQFQIEELRKFCEDYCLHSMQATGVCSLHEAANTYNCRRLAEATLQFIIENGEESLGSRDSINLTKEALLTVLQADDLVCEESTVFNCCARWVRMVAAKELGSEPRYEEGKEDARAARLEVERELFLDFTGYIRYPKIDPNTLRDTVRTRAHAASRLHRVLRACP